MANRFHFLSTLSKWRSKKRSWVLFQLLGLVLILGLLFESWAVLKPLTTATLQDGDLIFHTSLSSQSTAIRVATQSVYSHMGIIKRDGTRLRVVEAVGPVQETDLDTWIQRGEGGRFTVLRHRQLTRPLAQKLLRQARQYYGQPYDVLFRFNNGRLYCSEFPYLVYQSIGLSIGRVQKLGDLNTQDPRVIQLMRSRWKIDPLCKGLRDFESFQPRMLQQELVTPVSILQDRSMSVIYSNYPSVSDGIRTFLKG